MEAARTKAATNLEAKGRSVSESLAARGKLEVHVINATNLLAADSGGTSDPYVKVRLNAGGHEHKGETKVVKKTLNPRWDERFVFTGQLRDFVGETLQLKLRDHDKVGLSAPHMTAYALRLCCEGCC